MIIPTIFAHNKKEFDQRFKKLLPVSKNLQIDFMDGRFVKSKSISLSTVPNLRKYKKNFEAHLMVMNPENWIPELKQKGFRKIFFHYEATKNPTKIIWEIKSKRLISGVFFNPKTSFEKVMEVSPYADIILFMGHTPGVEHVPFDPEVYKKIKRLRALDPKIKIQIDGGANEKTIPKLAKLGVNYVNSGSYISDSEKPKQTFNKLNKLFKESR